jgi:hypothetical protein
VHGVETGHNAGVGFLRKLFGRSDEPVEDAPITLDVDARLVQLERLERGLDRPERACWTWSSRYGRFSLGPSLME